MRKILMKEKFSGFSRRHLLHLRAIVVLAVCLLVMPAFVNVGGTRINLSLKQASLEDVVREITHKSGMKFIYQAQQLKAVKGINIQIENGSVEEILNEVMAKSNLSWKIVDNVIVIKTKEIRTEISQQQQKKTISGVVKDDNGSPLPGANVFIKGTTNGVQTDVYGKYSLVAPERSVIVFSFLGYRNHEVLETNQSSINVNMHSDQRKINEVQIVGYGTQKKREVTGSISNLSAKDIKEIPTGNIASLLQGKVSGMSVINTSGSPGGGGASVTIRGFNSLSVEGERRLSSPLWVIDGVPVANFTSPVTGTNALSDIDPNDIESIQILKDAASASIYGSRAANGVILVTTKRGKDGKASFTK
ncbi:MAG: TonB-dependent receptor plug domain-containing protein, partial [Bacteroidota bacterium]|nr:TonB-dependent receptor plug domain-containing protein [Bacteroidota bacterium]